MDPDSLFFTFFYRTFMKQLKVQQQSIIPDARCSYLWDLKTGQAVHGFGHLCFPDARQNNLERCNVHYWDCLVNSKHQRSREVRQHLCMITLFYQPNPHAYMIVYGCLFVYSSSFHQMMKRKLGSKLHCSPLDFPAEDALPDRALSA